MYNEICYIAHGVGTSSGITTAFTANDAIDEYQLLTTAEESRNLFRAGHELVYINTVTNIHLRTQLLRYCRVVAEAYDLVERDYSWRRSTVLKVMVSPEFLFKPANGTTINEVVQYSHADFLQAKRALSYLFSNMYFEDWVFVPGTLVYDYGYDITQPYRVNFDTNLLQGTEMHYCLNTGFLISGGEMNMKTITKRTASDSDGIGDSWRKPQNLQGYLDTVERPASLFLRKRNLWLGMEICKDHGLGSHMLKNRLKEIRTNGTITNFEIDVHVVSAAGMGVKQISVAAKTNGYLLKIDGGGANREAGVLGRYRMHHVARQEYNDVDVIMTQMNYNAQAIRQWLSLNANSSITAATVHLSRNDPHYRSVSDTVRDFVQGLEHDTLGYAVTTISDDLSAETVAHYVELGDSLRLRPQRAGLTRDYQIEANKEGLRFHEPVDLL